MSTRRRTRSTAIACALAAYLPACSFAFVRPPPDDHAEREWFDCTESGLAPALDLLLATEAVGTVVLVESLDRWDGQRSDEALAIEIGALAVAGVALGSAVHGFSTTSRCESAKGRMHLRMVEDESAPLPRRAGCRADTDCKGDRICVDGRCHWAR